MTEVMRWIAPRCRMTYALTTRGTITIWQCVRHHGHEGDCDFADEPVAS